MNTTTIANNPSFVVGAIFLGFILLELACGCFRQAKGQWRDVAIEVIGSSLLLGLTVPLIFFLCSALLEHWAPQARGALDGLPWYAGLG
jgi:hypothetical protein